MADEYRRTRDALKRAAYRALLGREPDEGAAAEFVSQPFSPEQEDELVTLLKTFIDSDEFRDRFFETCPPPPGARARPGPAAFAELSRDLATLRASLGALERSMPTLLGQVAEPIESYGDYYERWIRHAEPIEGADRPVAVLLDAQGVSASVLEDAVWSVLEQSHRNIRLTVGLTQSGLAGLHDIMRRARGHRDLPFDYVLIDENPDWRTSAPVGNADVIVLARGDAVLHPNALQSLDRGLAADSGLGCLYADDDALAGDETLDWRLRPHAAPRLKPAFDEDLLLQTPYLGDLIAFSAEAWRQRTGAPPASHAEARFDGVWRAMDLMAAGAFRCGHLPLILSSRTAAADEPRATEWMERTSARVGDAAEVTAHSNLLGQPLPGAARLRWKIPPGTSAAVIIPTRDRIDLLEPCVSSILATMELGQTRMRLEIIDHDSREKATSSYLKRLARRDDVTIRPFSGAFNWALMNNVSASAAEEDVLVFLNNDTEVIAADWLDELVGQAMRPDVGVVGARLVYGDGHVQHAGFLALDHPDRFLTHDGLEDPGDSPGYLGRNILVHQTVAVTGACMAVRREVFTRLGGFDSARFHVEGNDVDLCFKAAAAGLKVLYTPYAALRHFESRTRSIDSAEAREASREASRRLWRRWSPNVCPDPWYNPRFERRGPPFKRLRPI